MASFPPEREVPAAALEMPNVSRWLEGWGDELGVGWEEEGELRGAAWPRAVEPVLVRDETTGEPLQEVIVTVSAETRGRGIGRRLMEGLLDRARAAGCSGLSLSVSERNPAAIHLYKQVGFVHHGQKPTGGLTMVWRPR